MNRDALIRALQGSVEIAPFGLRFLLARAADELASDTHSAPASASEPAAMGGVLQRVMARLADMLDDDQFKNIEAIIEGAGYSAPASVAGAGEALDLLREMTEGRDHYKARRDFYRARCKELEAALARQAPAPTAGYRHWWRMSPGTRVAVDSGLPDPGTIDPWGGTSGVFERTELIGRQAPAPLSQAVPEGEQPVDALRAAQEWIENSPHGDNCFVSDHYEGDPGNQCNCGKDSLLRYIDEALSDEPQPQAVTEDARDGERKGAERTSETLALRLQAWEAEKLMAKRR